MLEHFFGSTTRVKLLRIFFREPERGFYLRELSRRCNTQLNAIRREMQHLARIDLVHPISHEERGTGAAGTARSKFFKLNTASLLYPELAALLLKAQALEEQALVADIQARGGKVRLLILTGIFTSDDDVTTDMLMAGRLKPQIIAKLIRNYEKSLDKPIRYTLFTEQEFKDRRDIGDKFLYSVFEARHVKIVNEYNIS